ncbi:hypothetical protein HanIR_Chr08g0364941 [Helianthus annuus]|nr:hypothetical protein HanIR_Chr08g0364941 [Helianthus annuus]
MSQELRLFKCSWHLGQRKRKEQVTPSRKGHKTTVNLMLDVGELGSDTPYVALIRFRFM